MRSLLAILALAFVVVPATADELPVRKAGKWRITTVSDTVGMTTFETCIAPGDDIVTGVDKKGCNAAKVKHIKDEVFVDIACKNEFGSQKVSALLTGNYTTWYRAMSKITFDPPQGGIPNLGATIDGKFLSADCSNIAKH